MEEIEDDPVLEEDSFDRSDDTGLLPDQQLGSLALFAMIRSCFIVVFIDAEQRGLGNLL